MTRILFCDDEQKRLDALCMAGVLRPESVDFQSDIHECLQRIRNRDAFEVAWLDHDFENQDLVDGVLPLNGMALVEALVASWKGIWDQPRPRVVIHSKNNQAAAQMALRLILDGFEVHRVLLHELCVMDGKPLL